MQIDAPPGLVHFFLIGWRMGPGAVPQKVGVLVVKAVLHTSWTSTGAGGRRYTSGAPAAAPAEVLVADVPYATAPNSGPFRFESDLTPRKPELDAIVVRDLADDRDESVDPVQPAKRYGVVRFRRSGVLGAAHALSFGWAPRVVNPRLALAGQAATFVPQDNLPTGFDNRFFNGRRTLETALLHPSDRVHYVPTDGLGVENVNGRYGDLTLPAAPSVRVVRDGQTVPTSIEAGYDTFIFDLAAEQFLIVWRATFPWLESLADAVLEVT